MSTDLAQRKCTPCRGDVPPLTREEFAPLLARLPEGWEVVEDRRLVKAFPFRNFVQAVDFVQALTPIAEEEGHHPDLHVRWGEVRVELWTHKIGGLHENDFILAAKLDRLYREGLEQGRWAPRRRKGEGA